MRIIYLFVLISAFVCSAHAEEYNINRDKYDITVDAVEFKTKITETTWAYKWRGREYIFSFSSNGNISKLQSWEGVRWLVKQRNEVVLESNNNNTMYLYFNELGTSFKAVDWDGSNTSGKLVFLDDK